VGRRKVDFEGLHRKFLRLTNGDDVGGKEFEYITSNQT